MKKTQTFVIQLLLLLICLSYPGSLLAAGESNALERTVAVSPRFIDFSAGEQLAAIAWETKLDGRVDLFICDLAGRVVRTLLENTTMASGPQQLVWDGVDDNGVPCPNGVYVPIIRHCSKRGCLVANPCRLPWGGVLEVAPPKYDSVAGRITYTLDEPGLCLLRTGKPKGGPMGAVIVDWQPRDTGFNEEVWGTGFGKGQVQPVAIDALAFKLDVMKVPVNSILITGSGNTDYEAPTRRATFPLQPPHGGDVYFHKRMNPSRNPFNDVALTLVRGAVGDTSAASIPVVAGEMVFQAAVADPSLAVYEQGFPSEIYLFVDGQFVSETLHGKWPVTFSANTKKYANGLHVITTNFQSSSGHLAVKSMQVKIEN